MSLLEVRRKVERSLLATQGIVGIGQSEDKITVYVEGSPFVPTKIGGYYTETIKAGHIKALSLIQVPYFQPAKPLVLERTQRYRPCPGGVSVGATKVTAGTLALALSIGGRIYGLSNNHVLANASTIQNPRAVAGEEIIVQPGIYDGSDPDNPDDVIGRLASFVPLDEVGANIVDCAVFAPTTQDMLSPEILGIGRIKGFAQAEEGLLTQKSGRTSGVNSGYVRDTEATIKVDYGLFTATFQDQVVTDFMGEPGDSGSAVCDTVGPNLVALLFAGSNYITVHNKIENVLSALVLPPAEPRPPVASIMPFVQALSGLAMLGLSRLSRD